MARPGAISYEDALDSRYLSSSLSSLSQSRSTNTLIVRSYKQATQLYLTKRFREALDTLEPIVSPRKDSIDPIGTSGDQPGTDDGPAPVAQSSRGTRTKVWVFYLTLLHSIIELGQEEGKSQFGAARWRELARQVREGSIWEEVVQRGYSASEGDVDPDVVVNLATLLLGHMQTQKVNQQRLEAYLSASDAAGANAQLMWQEGISTPMSNTSSSPKMLATRLKILELYTLHVLPANDEWDYARSFIEMNELLDDERREAFLHALETLKEEKDGTATRERELQAQRERELEEERKQEEARQAEEARKEESRRKPAAEAERQRNLPPARSTQNGIASTSKQSQTTPSARPARNVKKPVQAPPPTFFRRASVALSNLQTMLLHAGRNMNFSSVATLRLLMFMIAFLLVIARQDLRAKLRNALDNGWRKVKQTVGMGVKVSYI